MNHIVRLIASALLAVALASCSSDAATTTTTTADTPATTAPPVTTTTTADTVAETTTTAPATTTTTQPEAVQVEVVYLDGVVETERRVSVPLGETVILTVQADVDDEIHVHGYDLFADVDPATPGTIEFVADIPGIFEVELESSHALLVELEVSP